MKTIRWMAVGVAVLVGDAAFVHADDSIDLAADVQQKINVLEKIVLQDVQAAPPSTPVQTGTTTPAMNTPLPLPIRYINSLRQDVAHKSYTYAIGAANNLAGADPSAAVQKGVAEILPELQKLVEAQSASVGSQTKDILDRASKAIASAKDPKDLDEIVGELGQAAMQNRTGYNDPDRQAAYNQIEGASRFVKGWQSYLADLASGNTMMAGNDLRNLANMPDMYSFMPIPRSELLARALKVSAQQPAIIDSKVEVHTFDDLPGAISELQALQRNGGGYNQDTSEMLNALQGLRNAYLSYQDKNYTAALQATQGFPFAMSSMVTNGARAVSDSSNGSSQNSLRKEIMALKDQLLVDIAQGLLSLPDAPAPNSGEHAADYLLRVADLKSKASDWTGLQQVLNVYSQFANNFYAQQSWLQEDMMGLHAYLIGEKLEAAGQTLDAIRSYRQSLATLGKFFPADPPAAKLKALAKQYPDLYQQALLKPISDSSSVPTPMMLDGH